MFLFLVPEHRPAEKRSHDMIKNTVSYNRPAVTVSTAEVRQPRIVSGKWHNNLRHKFVG